ncbi:hypothetical protein EKO27_g10353 [Xylaria grammica]|uniref:FAR1 domain-containing protein n=1 Tax=Xylaria grammica TaxID=363999 RepID=A0A439CRI0_9PEZI|nr:hypothetical protein EKO27_g10353 [Xylaria grammica]
MCHQKPATNVFPTCPFFFLLGPDPLQTEPLHLLRVCFVDPIKTSPISHGLFSRHLLIPSPYLPSSHTAQYRENLNLHHQQRLNNASSTVSASAEKRPNSRAVPLVPDDVVENGARSEARPRPFVFPRFPDNTAKISLQPNPHHSAVATGVVVPNGTASALSTPRQLPPTTTPTAATPVTPGTMASGGTGEPGTLAPPPEGIYRSFDDLLSAVQRVAKDQGYGVVKLRASNYRDGKPTRYDLVCDRGGVKYNSTAKKRNPSTRKVDCPWRAKAVCEVQLNNQWRFAVQDGRHNHEARVPAAQPGQENTPMAQSIRSLSNKLDRMNHDINQGFVSVSHRLESVEKRLEAMEARMGTMEARMAGMESRGAGMEVPMDNMEMEGSMLGASVL